MSRNLARMGSQLRSQATENCLLLMVPPLLYAELHAESALFAGRQALHFVFGFRRRRSVGIFDACQQPARRMRARIASALAARMHGITRRHIDGDPGVDAAIFAFNQVQEPCHFFYVCLSVVRPSLRRWNICRMRKASRIGFFRTRTTTVPASLSCHPCFLLSNATQTKPRPSGMADK